MRRLSLLRRREAPFPHGHLPPPALSDALLSELTITVLDTETTGLDPARDEIVSLAAVRISGGQMMTTDVFDRLVNPGRPIPPRATRIHGISDKMVQGQPDIGAIARAFYYYSASTVFGAHNTAFDLAFLARAEDMAHVHFDNPALDILPLGRFLEPGGDHSLEGLAERYHVGLEGRHSALGDSRIAAEILVHQMQALRARGVTRLGEAMAICGTVSAWARARAVHRHF